MTGLLRTALSLLAPLVLAGALAAPGHTRTAGGGATIAAAPTVVPGQQEFGSTTDGSCCDGRGADFWKLPLIPGDHVTVDWESTKGNGCLDPSDYWAMELRVWPAGTTDFSINNVNPIEAFGIGDNGKAESKFTANRSGIFPITFLAVCSPSSTGGPYDFTAYVRHLLVLSFPNPGTVRSGAGVSIAVHLADGSPVSDKELQVQVYGRWAHKWNLLGSSAPVNGRAVATLKITPSERGATIPLVARASGVDYVKAQTSPRVVRVR